MNRFSLLAILAFLSFVNLQAQQQWVLQWSEEFESKELDKNVWSKNYRNHTTWGQYMSSDPSLYEFRDGNLVLKAKLNDDKASDTSAYLTGGVWMRKKKSFGLGRIEIRAKFTHAQGFWPSIWMLPTSGDGTSITWPQGGEIDIMEHMHHDGNIQQTVHSNYTAILKHKRRPKSSVTTPFLPGEWNVYAVERYHDSVVFFVNGQRTLCYPRYRNGRKGQFPFDENEFYMILSAQLTDHYELPTIMKQQPLEMLVDYIRYYTPGSNNTIIPEPKTYEQEGKKTFRIKKIKVSPSSYVSPDEYDLKTENGTVTMAGNTVWAQQTLEQLKDENGKIPNVHIHDDSSYPFRCFMHDTGRNYQPLSMLKETIDLMSFYKLNYFHWHLTDYPAWRIESKAYPQLNDPKYQRKGRDEGKYYTYDEIRELIAYARERGITVVPEIDMPGHSTYFTDAFGFSMDSPKGREILTTCLEEFFEEIPAESCPYFHIGSDEVYIDDPKGFMQWAENIVLSHHRTPIAWDPGLPASDKVVRQIWNDAAGSNAAASNKPGRYVDSFMGYLNYYDPMMFTSKVFLHTAAAQKIPNTNKALGGILCLWNDVRVDEKENISLHNGMINGMMAYAERFWNGGDAGEVQCENLPSGPATPAGSKLANFEKKMSVHRDRYHGASMRWVANSSIKWLVTVDKQKPVVAYGGAVDLDALCQTNKIAIDANSTAKAVTHFSVDTDCTIQAWIGFDVPARSNRNGVGIGTQNCWEGKASVKLNGVDVQPAQHWNEPGKYQYHFNTWGKPEEEQPYTDEQFYWMRTPALLNLKKGENAIEIKVPKLYDNVRWSFAFIPVETAIDGSVSEVEGLVYY